MKQTYAINAQLRLSGTSFFVALIKNRDNCVSQGLAQRTRIFENEIYRGCRLGMKQTYAISAQLRLSGTSVFVDVD